MLQKITVIFETTNKYDNKKFQFSFYQNGELQETQTCDNLKTIMNSHSHQVKELIIRAFLNPNTFIVGSFYSEYICF
jgi:hypothetical protein